MGVKMCKQPSSEAIAYGTSPKLCVLLWLKLLISFITIYNNNWGKCNTNCKITNVVGNSVIVTFHT